jgi:hypothetical protein
LSTSPKQKQAQSQIPLLKSKFSPSGFALKQKTFECPVRARVKLEAVSSTTSVTSTISPRQTTQKTPSLVTLASLFLQASIIDRTTLQSERPDSSLRTFEEEKQLKVPFLTQANPTPQALPMESTSSSRIALKRNPRTRKRSRNWSGILTACS